jgi:hypothetical protein
VADASSAALFLCLDSYDHYFGGLYQRGSFVTTPQTHFARGIGRDDRGDVLAADGELDLRQQAFNSHFHNAAYQLIAAADIAKVGALFGRLLAQ